MPREMSAEEGDARYDRWKNGEDDDQEIEHRPVTEAMKQRSERVLARMGKKPCTS